MDQATLTQVIGITAGICTGISLLPQLIKILRKKKDQGLSLFYLIVLLAGLILWVIYGVMRDDIPVIATNVLSLVLNIATIAANTYYKKHPQQ